MSGFEGMDVDQVKQLSVNLDQASQNILHLAQQLTTALDSANWKGPDREAFVSNWHSAHLAALNNVGHSTQEAATAARRNAQEQEAASSH
jgi:hypothetical protein